MVDLGARQLELIARCRGFLLSRAQRGTDVALTPECYLNGWAAVPGNARLRQLAGERGGILRGRPERLHGDQQIDDRLGAQVRDRRAPDMRNGPRKRGNRRLKAR